MADINNPSELVIPPPMPKMLDYPSATIIMFGVVATAVLLIAVNRFDSTGGTLTLSLLVVLAFIGTVVFCLFFTVPNDEVTAGIIGGLIAAFGAIMSYWLSKTRN